MDAPHAEEHIKGVVTMPAETVSYDEAYLMQDMGFEKIDQLPLDHPGARDPEYRLRRNYIADMARLYRRDPQRLIPLVEYTEEEEAVWRHVCGLLAQLHRRRACALYLKAKQQLGISSQRIPQLRELNGKLAQAADFRLAPIEGLVETRAFLTWLGKRTML